MKQLNIIIVGINPTIVQKGIKLIGIPLAPLALKAYAYYKLDSYKNMFNISIHTYSTTDIDMKDVATEILNKKPDIVSFSVYIWNYRQVIECINYIKATNKDIVIICGGPQVSPIAIEIMENNKNIDIIPYIVIPGEVIFYNIIKNFLLGSKIDSVEGIVYRNDGKLVKTDELTEQMDYDNAPSPYLEGYLLLEKNKQYTVVIEGFRGCPMDCAYCFYGKGIHKLSFFPLERVLKEIDYLYKIPNIKQVIYADSDMFLNGERTKSIVNHILKQNSRTISELDVHILGVREDFVKLLSKLPNYNFCFGVQTFNPSALRYISDRRPDVNLFIKKFNNFKKWAPKTEYYIDIMIGLPGDSINGFMNTVNTCLQLEPTRLRPFYPIFLLPGTTFYKEKNKFGIKHGANHPYCIIETETFKKKDIEYCFRFSIWMEILTYYYPEIKKFFYDVCKKKKIDKRIDILKQWISSIEKNIDIFNDLPNMTDIAEYGDINEWNELKSELLRRASEEYASKIIYKVVNPPIPYDKLYSIYTK